MIPTSAWLKGLLDLVIYSTPGKQYFAKQVPCQWSPWRPVRIFLGQPWPAKWTQWRYSAERHSAEHHGGHSRGAGGCA